MVITVAGNRAFDGPSCDDGGFLSPPYYVAIDTQGNVYTLGYELDQVADGGEVVTVVSAGTLPNMNAMAVSSNGSLVIAALNGGGFDQLLVPDGGAFALLAGDGEATCGDTGSDAGAGFDLVSAMAADSAGNLYVTEYNDKLTACTKIRKVTATGVISTLSGEGAASWRDGAGDQALFSYPSGIVVAGDGTVYVADTGNNVIRKVKPDGTTSTFAGAVGSGGFADGYGDQAMFNGPTGLAMDAHGTLYVADLYNYSVRAIDAEGHVTTVAGNGQPGLVDGTLGLSGSAEFVGPTGLAIDTVGNIWVTDRPACSLREIKFQ